MKCFPECGGACCESFSLPLHNIFPPGADEMRWIELHGDVSGGRIEFECRCTALTDEGKCGIYENRPDVCRVYEAGGKHCLETVRARRTPEQYAEIRDEDDPPVEELFPPQGGVGND